MESVFKYIFALIVGALLIIFFVSFAMKYMGTAETMQATELVIGFDDYLMLRSGSPDSTGSYPFAAQTTIEFGMGKIKSSKISRNTNRIVFAPAKLTGKSIVIWTKRWSFPYAVDNFFYMANDRVKHIIIYDDGASEFAHELVDEINDSYKMDSPRKYETGARFNEYLTAVKNRYSTASKIRLVVVSTGARSIVNAIEPKLPKNADIISVSKDPDAESWEYGIVKFGEDEAPYIGNEMIIAAMFAEDADNYMFGFRQAMQRLADITYIYWDKAGQLEAGTAGSCTEYSFIKSMLLEPFRIAADEAAGRGRPDVKRLAMLAKSIKKENRRSFGGECPALF